MGSDGCDGVHFLLLSLFDNNLLGFKGHISTLDTSNSLELGYLEFCDSRSVYLNQKCILIAFSNHNLALETFLQVKITQSANLFELRVI